MSETQGPAKRGAGGRRPGSPAGKSARRWSRELALQGLYGWLVSPGDPAAVDAHIREQDGFNLCDAVHYDALLHGCIREAATLDEALAEALDRKPSALSPVEHAILLIGAYELSHCLDIPYRVSINEAVELAKSFGGTDGHKYVNGVLDRTAQRLRVAEAQQGKSPRP